MLLSTLFRAMFVSNSFPFHQELRLPPSRIRLELGGGAHSMGKKDGFLQRTFSQLLTQLLRRRLSLPWLRNCSNRQTCSNVCNKPRSRLLCNSSRCGDSSALVRHRRRLEQVLDCHRLVFNNKADRHRPLLTSNKAILRRLVHSLSMSLPIPLLACSQCRVARPCPQLVQRCRQLLRHLLPPCRRV